jgi:hypothetical protein
LDTGSSSSGKPKLSAYESELRRLLEMAGDTPVRLLQPDAISHQDAIAAQRRTFVGSSYARQSEWLTKLIRSGYFKELSLALPITNADELRRRTAESRGGKIRVGADGQLGHEAETAVERPLMDLGEFLQVLVVTLLPTLFDRPQAMLDWLELARSTVDITKTHGWEVARTYLMDLLSDRVPTGTPFNCYDATILQSACAQRGGGAPGAAAGVQRPQQQQQQQQAPRQSWKEERAHGVCLDWNMGVCRREPCAYAHKCQWKACASPDDGHRGKDCPKRPKMGGGGGGQQRQPVKVEQRRR